MLRPHPDHPIEEETVDLIREVTDVARQIGLPVFLVGAMARILLLEHVYGLPRGRATRDIDFAFAVADWDTFEAIKAALIETSRFNASNGIAHRLFYRPSAGGPSAMVDLMPFGGVEDARGQISWPPELSIVMNVVGYQDASASTVQIQIEEDLVLSVVSLPASVLLKLFAWRDRRNETTKDAIDLYALLRRYSSAGAEDRIYTEANEQFESVGYDIELAGAWLLGRDAWTVAGTATRSRARDIITNASRVNRLIDDMMRASTVDNSYDLCSALVEQFAKGFQAQDVVGGGI